MKTCVDPDCPEFNPQPMGNFYDHPTYADRKQKRCKTCCLRMLHETRRLQAEGRITAGETYSQEYIERHERRRKEEAELEATICLEQPSTGPEEYFAASSFIGMIDAMLRPKTKESRWQIR